MTGFRGDMGDRPADDSSSGGGPAVPMCYRHHARETYVRCSRCNRYICPDCMSAAPVGFHCPECVAESRKSGRQARTVLGGEIRESGDVITKTLIAFNVVVWLLGLVYRSGESAATSFYVFYSEGVGTNELAARLGLVLGTTMDGVDFGVVDGQWYRLLTAAFFHEQFWHIGMNMFALWILGSALEPVLGRWRFISLYLISALGGTAASLLAASEYGPLSYGASGAVFGLMGALFIVMRRLGRETGAVVAILAINVVLGFMVQGIDWRAHLGGLVVGGALALAFAYAPRAHRTLWAAVGCTVTFAAITAAVTVALLR